MSQQTQNHLSRRRFLSASLCAGGAGLGLGDVLRLRSLAADQGSIAPDTSVIQIWLGGGPSQFETFDPKPLAPVEIRGPYRPIQSKIPGVLACETMPLTAAVLDKTAIIKSFTHPFDDHFGLVRWCLEGRKEADKREGYPSFGSIASKFRGPRRPGMPAYVMLSEEPVMHHHLFDAMGPGYLGVSHSPFAVLQDPYPSDFQFDRLKSATSSLELANDATLDRINDRQSLLAELNRLPRRLDSNRVQEGLDPFAKLALELITSAKARQAFDLNAESAATREHTDHIAGDRWRCWLGDWWNRESPSSRSTPLPIVCVGTGMSASLARIVRSPIPADRTRVPIGAARRSTEHSPR